MSLKLLDAVVVGMAIEPAPYLPKLVPALLYSDDDTPNGKEASDDADNHADSDNDGPEVRHGGSSTNGGTSALSWNVAPTASQCQNERLIGLFVADLSVFVCTPK